MKKIIYSLMLGIVIIDQVLKFWITKKFVLYEFLFVIPKFFYLTYTKNTGGAWSLFQDYPYLLILISGGFLILFNRYLLTQKTFSKLETISYGLLMGGVFGNFIDRILADGVIDYLGFQFGSYFFPIFNFADMAIVIGVGLLIIETLWGEENEIRSRKK